MSDCSCIFVDVECGDCTPFLNIRNHTAKKEHTCSECNRVIKKDEKYECVFGVWDNVPSIYKTCQDCKSIRDAFFCEGYYYSMLLFYLKEHLLEIDGNLSSDCMKNLTPKARDRVCDMIETIWSEE